jgi:hypothetical protein
VNADEASNDLFDRLRDIGSVYLVRLSRVVEQAVPDTGVTEGGGVAIETDCQTRHRWVESFDD